jgi:tubulin polyglutamylase TTLL6/13
VVTSCSPLTIFWHKAGLARFATLPYSLPAKTNKDMSQNVHLTNYAVNKDSEHFKISDEDI